MIHFVNKICVRSITIFLAGLALVATGLAGPVYAANSPSLGAAGSFSALAGVAMSAAAPGTTVAHDIGLSPGLESSRTGNWTVAGSQYFGPLTLAGTAQSAALGAFNNLATQGSDGTWSLNPAPLPGVWTAASSATFAGPKLTLDGGYDDVWVFQIGADFTFTGSVALTGNAQPCHVFWQVGGDATIASGSTFAGTLIASGNVTVVSGATVNGRIISLNGALTTDGNNISGPTCLTAPPVTPASLHVIKVVNNDNGGSKSASDFSFMINGGTATAFQTGGENDLSLAPGTYSVTEPAGLGYSTTYDNCSNLAIASGALATCIITNDDRAPSLTLDKIVVNDDGGTAAESDWVLTAAGPTLISGHGAAGSADVVSGPTFLAGTYTLSESTGPTGYNASPWSCAKNGAAPVNGPQIVLDVGDSAICTITNDDIDPQAGQAATLHIIKHVSNNNGGTLSAKDFSFSVNGGTAQAFEADGQNDLTVSAGTYSVIEQAVAGYTTSYDNCSNLAISAGGSATCTITNDDIAPSLTLDKIVINNNGGNVSESAWTLTADGGTAGTLSGPGAAGSADVQSGNNFKAGTYALSESVGPAGYSASAWSCVKNQNQPVASALITLGLGDKATCTITNTYNVLVSGVSGGGNGSAYTLPVPPLIDVVKIPSPLTLPAGPGPVTYTYILRNIGTVGVTNITLADDACNPVTLVAGDINTDSQLETNETWTYRC